MKLETWAMTTGKSEVNPPKASPKEKSQNEAPSVRLDVTIDPPVGASGGTKSFEE